MRGANNGYTPLDATGKIPLQYLPSDLSDKNYEHDQGVASASWTINHNLNKFPAVTCLDSALNEVEGEVVHIDENNLTINFNAAFSGSATLN
jgi:hypothetical protein